MERWRAAVARQLEAGAHDGPVAALASAAWARLAAPRVARPLHWRCDDQARTAPHVIAVGGATLGGSGKTPLAIACVAALASRGLRVALVGHAYRAARRSALAPRVVRADDDVRVVGDEALLAARALATSGAFASVVVAGTRQAALAYALERASFVVLDGVAQTAPRRASLALLALDADAPWGAGACPPAGDLRAPVASLLAACDRVVVVDDAPEVSGRADRSAAGARSPLRARVASSGAHLGTRPIGWTELASLRIGVVTTLARPSRVVAFLARRGVEPAVVVDGSDHAPLPASSLRRARAARVDLWLTTAKCALQLARADAADRARPSADGLGDAPLAVLDYALVLSPELEGALHGPPSYAVRGPIR